MSPLLVVRQEPWFIQAHRMIATVRTVVPPSESLANSCRGFSGRESSDELQVTSKVSSPDTEYVKPEGTGSYRWKR